MIKEIEKNKTRLKNAQVLMLDGELNPTEYKEMKIKLEKDMVRLTIEENKLRSNTTSYDKVIESCRNVVLNLDIAYNKAEASIKQRIVGSIFPEKFVFENNRVRTTKVNEMIDRVCRKIEGCSGNKKGQQSFYELLPCRVGDTGFEPVTPCL